MTDRSTLSAAIEAMTLELATNASVEATQEQAEEVLKAARAHLEALPAEPDDHIILCRNRMTGEVSIFNALGKSIFSESEAKDRAARWANDFPYMRYLAAKVP